MSNVRIFEPNQLYFADDIFFCLGVLRLDLPTREDLLLPIDVDVDNTGAPCTTVITEVSYIASGVSSFLTQALLVWSFFQSGKFGAIVILSCILDLLIYVLNSRIEHQGGFATYQVLSLYLFQHYNRPYTII